MANVFLAHIQPKSNTILGQSVRQNVFRPFLPFLAFLAFLAFLSFLPFLPFLPLPHSGFMCGNSSTSRIDGVFVNSITMRSTPMPSPAVGGKPYSSART